MKNNWLIGGVSILIAFSLYFISIGPMTFLHVRTKTIESDSKAYDALAYAYQPLYRVVLCSDLTTTLYQKNMHFWLGESIPAIWPFDHLQTLPTDEI